MARWTLPLAASLALTVTTLQESPPQPGPPSTPSAVAEASGVVPFIALPAGRTSALPALNLEWNRQARVTLASTNPGLTASSNGSFWAWHTNCLDVK